MRGVGRDRILAVALGRGCLGGKPCQGVSCVVELATAAELAKAAEIVKIVRRAASIADSEREIAPVSHRPVPVLPSPRPSLTCNQTETLDPARLANSVPRWA